MPAYRSCVFQHGAIDCPPGCVVHSELIILALASIVAFLLLGLAWWVWRHHSMPRSDPQRTSPPSVDTEGRAMDRFAAEQGRGFEAPQAKVHVGHEPAETEAYLRDEPSTDVFAVSYTPSERGGTVLSAPPERGGTVLSAPPERGGTVLSAPPERGGTVLSAPPERSETLIYTSQVRGSMARPRRAAPRIGQSQGTAVVPLERMPFAMDPVDPVDDVEQATQVISLYGMQLAAKLGEDDEPTRLVSREQIFADQTITIPRDEIIAMAKAARTIAREVSRVAPAPTDPESVPPKDPTHARARPPKTLELDESALPPPAWTSEPESAPRAEPHSAPIEVGRVQDPSPAKAPELSESVFAEHFEAAVAALHEALSDAPGRDLSALAEGAQARWESSLGVLELNGERAAELVLLPTLFTAEQPEQQRFAAAMALLNMKGSPGLLDALEGFDEGCHHAVTRALAYLDDEVRAESIAAMGSALVDGAQRLSWLDVFVRRAADPGAELIHELLDASERDALAMGLRMLPFHAKAQSFATQVDRKLLSTKPAIRSEAIVAGLVLDRPSAWMQCKQAARAPDFPAPCLLLATLGTSRDRERLVSWASRAAAPAYAGWVLGVSGWPVGIRASLELAQRGEEQECARALAGFNVATGASADTVDAAAAWWEAHGDRFEDGRRYLGGEPMTSASLAAALSLGSQSWREAIALELLVRSKGALRLPTAFMPARAGDLATHIELCGLDLEAAYRAS
ncbi:hypothetical protein G6O69_17695 [Pseudenhygromyxa sp. WMMC2535]|uniref:hypothetical protein n=1 Tax=Pseudenhygromyxa sp. WMMC2535 TaxID=2712867 RepID=UPI001595AD4E|nr:hypothetical protein [Pseudenhygromyxa sp. WMMC2535]NVB39681.1 hypothetical protein [Pseudenhygromyxa sp. WMMC2535]